MKMKNKLNNRYLKSILAVGLSLAMVLSCFVTMNYTKAEDQNPQQQAKQEQAQQGFQAFAQADSALPSDDDFTAYLFASFTGTEGNPNDEQIYFAVSEDGYNYTDLNNGKPVLVSDIGEKGVRDPYILRSKDGDKFYLIATDLSIYYRGGWGRANATVTGSHNLVLWESEDLVNWSDPRLIEVASPDAGCAWAPEAIYNEKTDEYVIYFAESTLVNGRVNGNMCIYCVTTEDFETFSEAERFIVSPGRDIIDTSILKADDGYYYRASKDGANDDRSGSIRVDKSDDIFGEWETITSLSKLGFSRDMNNTSLEGPELFKFNKRDWIDDTPTYGVYTDRYMEGTGYLPLVTTDFNDVNNANGSWDLLADGTFFFDNLKKRHGTIMNITQDEYERILYAYANNESPKSEEPVKNSTYLSCDFEDGDAGEFTLNGNAKIAYDDEKKSNVLTLDGSTGTYAELPTGYFDGMNSFTVSFDVKTEDVSGNYFTFCIGLNNNRYIFLKTADTSRLSVAKNGSRYEQSISGATSLQGKWVNATITFDENDAGMCVMKLYIDGDLVGSKNTYTKPTILGSNLISYLGRSFFSSDKYFSGSFDNFTVFNQALGEKEIAEYAKTGKFIDYDIAVTSNALDIKNTIIDREKKTVTIVGDWKDLTGDLSKCDATVSVNNDAKITSAAGGMFDPKTAFPITVVSKDGLETQWIVRALIGNNPATTPGDNPSNPGTQTPGTQAPGNQAPTAQNPGNSPITNPGIGLEVPGKITIGVKEKVKIASDAGTTLKIDNPSVISLDGTGSIKGLKAGKATITASNIGASTTVEVTVKKAPSKIKVTPKKKTLKKGKKLKLKVKLPKNSASYKITYKSSKKSVATVDVKGVVRAKKKGKAVITVSTFNKKKAKVKITVK